jgi:hypothetical protein
MKPDERYSEIFSLSSMTTIRLVASDWPRPESPREDKLPTKG